MDRLFRYSPQTDEASDLSSVLAMHDVTSVEYLCVDEFLLTLSAARTLHSAFELGVIDPISESSRNCPQLKTTTACNDTSLRLLLQLLICNTVVRRTNSTYVLTDNFTRALQFRELLEATLTFALAVAPDVITLFTLLLHDHHQFMRKATVFSMTDYSNCLIPTPQHYAPHAAACVLRPR